MRVRLDERRIGEILAGIDSASMGPAFVSTAGRLLGHLGDVMTLGFTPAALAGAHAWQAQRAWGGAVGAESSCMRGRCAEVHARAVSSGARCRLHPPTADPKVAADGQPPSQYLFQFESSDISRLRADVQSLGFVSLVRCAGAAEPSTRLTHGAGWTQPAGHDGHPALPTPSAPFMLTQSRWHGAAGARRHKKLFVGLQGGEALLVVLPVWGEWTSGDACSLHAPLLFSKRPAALRVSM